MEVIVCIRAYTKPTNCTCVCVCVQQAGDCVLNDFNIHGKQTIYMLIENRADRERCICFLCIKVYVYMYVVYIRFVWWIGNPMLCERVNTLHTIAIYFQCYFFAISRTVFAQRPSECFMFARFSVTHTRSFSFTDFWPKKFFYPITKYVLM